MHTGHVTTIVKHKIISQNEVRNDIRIIIFSISSKMWLIVTLTLMYTVPLKNLALLKLIIAISSEVVVAHH